MTLKPSVFINLSNVTELVTISKKKTSQSVDHKNEEAEIIKTRCRDMHDRLSIFNIRQIGHQKEGIKSMRKLRDSKTPL